MQSTKLNKVQVLNAENQSPSPNESKTGQLFDKVWKENQYNGFSHQTTGESKTPFLNLFLGELSPGGLVVELGAGSFDHAVRMAKEGSIVKQVTGIEYSQTAVNDAKERAKKLDQNVQSRLKLECGDLFTFFNHFEKNTLSGIYANSVFHFLTQSERQKLYRECYQLLKRDGIIGVSFKFQGDALFKRGEIVEQTDAGNIICDSTDQIKRLFVSPSGIDVLADEIQAIGFEMCSIIRWTVSDYNIEGDKGLFVGFLAKRI